MKLTSLERRLLALIWLALLPALYFFVLNLPTVSAASGRIIYISFSSGSDSNTLTQAESESTPWKTHPKMQCAGANASAYTHLAGDTFIFKGGDTWPTNCFSMGLGPGGTSSAQDYIGVCVDNADFANETNLQKGAINDSPCAGTTSWPSSGWTRPVFGNSVTTTPTNNVMLINANQSQCFAAPSAGNYITVDNIEMTAWDVKPNTSWCFNTGILMGGALPQYASTGTVLENMYIHDYASNENSDPSSTECTSLGCPPYAITFGVANERNNVIADPNGYYFVGSSKQVSPIAGGCEGCVVMSGNHITYAWEGCSHVYDCHYNEIDHIQGGLDAGIHTHMIYDDGAGQNSYYAYGNYLHDSDPGLQLNMFYSSYIFNNVFSNNLNNVSIYLEECPPGQGTSPCGDNSSQVGWVANNTIDQTNGSGACYKYYLGPAQVGNSNPGLGTLNVKNNICLGPNGVGSFSMSGSLITGGPNGGTYLMGSPEAATYGFTPANKYSPSSADPNTSAQGANSTSSCTGKLTPMCQDASGAPWFGGSFKSRPTGSTLWDLGAFQGQGGANGPPTCSITAPSNNASISGSSVTLTATCSPQGSATISSIQFSVDGISFGTAGSSSPYSVTLNSTFLSNTTHSISAVGTDSNSQNGTAPSINATVNNSVAGFVTDARAGNNSTYIQTQSFTTCTSACNGTFFVTPDSGTTNDSVLNFSNGVATGYGSAAGSLRTNSSGDFDAYDGTTSTYHALNTVAFVAGTTYTVTWSWSPSPCQFSISVGGTAIATNFGCRTSVTQITNINGISDAGLYDTVAMTGFQLGSATSLSFNPTSLNFGNVATGSSPTLNITVTPTGGTVTFSSITASGSPFTKSADACSPSSSTACTVTVQFSPSSTGAFNGSVVFTDTATGSPQTIALTGVGVSSTAVLQCSPASFNFNASGGGVQLFTSQGQGQITCTAVGGGVSTVAVAFTATAGSNISDIGFSQNSCSGTIAQNASCSFTPLFSPQMLAPQSGTYTISWTGGSTTVSVSGQGVNRFIPAPF